MIYDYIFPGEINVLYTKPLQPRRPKELHEDHQLGICAEFTNLRRACPELLREIPSEIFRTRIVRFELGSHSSFNTIHASIQWLNWFHTSMPLVAKEPWYGIAVCFDNESFKPPATNSIKHLEDQQRWSEFCRLLPPYQHFYVAFTDIMGDLRRWVPSRNTKQQLSELSVATAWINSVLQSSTLLKEFVVSHRARTLDDYYLDRLNGPEMLLHRELVPKVSTPWSILKRQELLLELNETIHQYLETRIPTDARGRTLRLTKRPAWPEHFVMKTKLGELKFESWVMKLERHGYKLKLEDSSSGGLPGENYI